MAMAMKFLSLGQYYKTFTAVITNWRKHRKFCNLICNFPPRTILGHLTFNLQLLLLLPNYFLSPFNQSLINVASHPNYSLYKPAHNSE